VALLETFTVATQAAGVRFLPGQVFEADDFRDISACCDVLGTGTVARFASVSVRQRGFEMGRVLEILFE
jgi:hypothetical protein